MRVPVEGRVCYVLNHSFPFASNGYAVRSHGVAAALAARDFSVIAVARPGYPWDLPGFPARSTSSKHEIDGVKYVFSRMPRLEADDPDRRHAKAMQELIDQFETFRPAAVIAASNWDNALPALRASRALGLPFFYEVRGFWELSELGDHSSPLDGTRFRASVERELEVASGAERVFTLNGLMRDELVRRGVPAAKIDIVPNAIVRAPPDGWRDDLPAERRERRFRIGYLGSFAAYEGLDDLVTAVHGLRADGWDLSLRLVGSSNGAGITDSTQACTATLALRAQAAALGIADQVVFLGRVEPSRVVDLYRDLDLFVMPRKPWPVCEIVQPLKPLEAAAHGCPVLASDVAPLAELARTSGFALFRKGSIEDLRAGIAELLGDADRRRRMSEQGRLWVETDRLFERAVAPLADALSKVMPGGGPSPPRTRREPPDVPECPAVAGSIATREALRRIRRHGLNRFRVTRRGTGWLQCVDILHDGVKRLSEDALRNVAPSDLDLELVRLGFLSPRMGSALRPVTARPASHDDVHFWQFPARTEASAWDAHATLAEAVKRDGAIHVYLGLPWATWIDKQARSGSMPPAVQYELRMQEVRLQGIHRFLHRLGVRLRVHTVCQHVQWRAFLPYWHDLGITDAWLAHAAAAPQGAEESGIRLHPWSLHAVNVESPERGTGLSVGVDPSCKPLLASFVGAHSEHYLSDSRLRLQALANEPRFHIRLTQGWHFENDVYRHQIEGHALPPGERHADSVRHYNAVLSDSRFSLCPPGAGANTIRLWESLAVGSVPILVGRAPLLPEGGTLPRIDWDAIVVRVADDHIAELPRILASMPLEEVRRRQRLGMQAYARVRQQRCF